MSFGRDSAVTKIKKNGSVLRHALPDRGCPDIYRRRPQPSVFGLSDLLRRSVARRLEAVCPVYGEKTSGAVPIVFVSGQTGTGQWAYLRFAAEGERIFLFAWRRFVLPDFFPEYQYPAVLFSVPLLHGRPGQRYDNRRFLGH